MDQLGTLIESLAALAWPLIVIILLVSFRDVIKAVLESARSRKFTIRVAGNELTMEEASEQQRALISDLQKQMVAMQETLDSLIPKQPAAEALTAEPTPERVKSILWVDDNPRNNATLIDSLSKLEIDVVTTVSTNEALAKCANQKFDRIVTDMGRTESGEYHRTAGLDLTKKIRADDRNIPIVIYCNPQAARTYRQEALAAGANEITSSPTILMNALQLGLSTLAV